MILKCPGQDKRNVKIESYTCPGCGYEIEMFSDEFKASCPRCQKVVPREVLPTCIDWCRYAKECVGEEAFKAHLQGKSSIMKEKLIKGLEDYFGEDKRRINHAKKVMGFAEELLRKEGGDWHIVIPASILHDVGIKAAEKKYGSSTGHYQEDEGPAIAAQILRKESFKKEDIDEISEIIAHHHSPGKVNTVNFKLLYDADWLVNFAESDYLKKHTSASRPDALRNDCVREKDEVDTKDKTKLAGIIERVFLTEAGKQKAKELYLQGGNQ
ncbi:MAG: HD domain-containing protein [Candidatus Omnitrophota bacterium]